MKQFQNKSWGQNSLSLAAVTFYWNSGGTAWSCTYQNLNGSVVEKYVFQATDYSDWINSNFYHILSSLSKNIRERENNEKSPKMTANKRNGKERQKN